MSWIFVQSTGVLLAPDGTVAADGYSGHGAGLDNPADQFVPDVGPIPAGSYTIGLPFTHPVCGPISMRLTPAAGTEMDGRAGFLIHGDNQALNHTASDGCVILPRDVRERIAMSRDNELLVVATA